MALATLGLGSNLGARATLLAEARAALAAHGTVGRASRLYESAPVGYLDQPAFLNQVLELETALAPCALLTALKQIEQRLGRMGGFRNGPRCIDLDILLYDDIEVHEPDLVIPHARMLERAFVLRPLAELRTVLLGRPMSAWLEAVAGQDAAPVPAAAGAP